jgi:enterochelin esterase-like enzyme
VGESVPTRSLAATTGGSRRTFQASAGAGSQPEPLVPRSNKRRGKLIKKLRSIHASRSEETSGTRKRRWVRRVLALVAVLVLAFSGVGAFMGYDYCTRESGDNTLNECVTDTAVNTYRTLWGNSLLYQSDVSATGTVATKTFDSKALGQSIQYAIYLPPGYDDPQNSSTRYPVVYLLPGSSGSIKTWMNGGSMGQQMDSLLAQGKVRPMILVVPEERPGLQSVKGTGYADGPLGNWATYTTQDVVDEIDSNYRTIASKDGRAVAGNSEGGYGAMNLGLKNPSEYGVIGSFSGYFTIDEDDLSRIFGGDQSLAEENSPMLYLPQLEGELPAIYFYVGQDDQHYLDENQKFAEELKARGATYEFETFPGMHNWDLWGAHLPDFLVFASEHLAGGE